MRLFGLTLFLVVAVMDPVRAATWPAGADLVFLVDQSGSMMGKGATRIANDPYGKRVAAIKQLDAQLLQSATAGFVNRISVIEFGGRNAENRASQPQVTLARKEIPAVAPGQDPSRTRALILATLNPLRAAFRGDTDIAEGMRLAQQELDQYQRNPPALGPGAKAGDRVQIVVLITDGAAYAEGVQDKQMKREIEGWTARLPKQASVVKFLVFGINDASRYWDDYWGAFWRGVTARDTQSPEGLAFRIDPNDPKEDVVEKVGEVLSDLIPPGAKTGNDDTYTAPAYLKSLTFNIAYDTPHLKPGTVVITDPAGNPLPLTDEQDTSARILLPYPVPGQYRLRSASAPYRVQALPVYEGAKLVAPTLSVQQASDMNLRYQLDGRGPNGRFLPQGNLPVVRFAAEVESPGGARQTLTLAPDQATGDVVSQAPFRFDQQGRYRVAFTGTTKTQDGTEAVVYRSDDILQVDAATPFQAYFVAPDPAGIIRLWQGEAELPVDVRFRNAHTGVDIPAAQVLNPGSVLRVAFQENQAPGQERASRAAPQAAVLQAGGTGLAATVTVGFDGTRWDLLSRSAKGRLRIEPQPADPWRSDLRYNGIASTGDYWLGPELEMRESLGVLWIVALVLAGLVAAAVLFWRFFMIRWLIARSDRKYRRHPRLNYTVRREPERCARDWPLRGVHVLTEPRLVTLADGNSWSIDKFEIRRLRRPGQKVAVQVTYRAFGAKKGKVRCILEATGDSMAVKSRHSIAGLSDELAADLVLFTGRSDSI